MAKKPAADKHSARRITQTVMMRPVSTEAGATQTPPSTAPVADAPSGDAPSE